MKYLHTIILLLFIVSNVSAQTIYIKKPSKELEKLTDKVKNTTADSLIYFFNKGVLLSKKEKNIEAETQLNTLLIQRLYVGGEHDKTVKYFLTAVKQFENLKPYDERILLYFEGSGVYSKNKEFETALKFIKKGLEDAEKLNLSVFIADGYNRKGVVLERQGHLDEAMTLFQNSLKINEAIKDENAISYSLDNISGIYGAKNQPLKGLPFQKRSLAIRKKLNNEFAISIALINISESYNLLNQLDSAIIYAKQSLAISHKIHFVDLEQYTLNHLSEIYKKQGKYNLALNFKEQGITLKDSIFNEKKSQQIKELTTQYETEKKEQQIKDLSLKTKIKDLEIEKKNTLLILGVALLFLILMSVWFYLNQRKIKNKIALQKAIINQQDIATKAVLDAEERERRRIATDLHDGVGQMLSATLMNLNGFAANINDIPVDDRNNLEKSLALLNESYDEMRSISHQMMPNALLKAGLTTAVREFLSKIDESQIKINLDITGFKNKLNDNLETVLYRVIQESVNNVIKHAKATKLSLQLNKDEEGISITIEDNGVGFDPNKNKDGIGLSNIKSRINFINGTVEYDSAPGKGTFVNIFIPA
ncbi:tetratricopeptide repeat-containing sensor histidine kinase [Pedobacter alpinus]|uniref:Oxygen sensor histidine kinase NreB n=1 Tax=Pedobacter alpinus TaxID=1590643 RepID=A0ABW5TVV6_9SPHI